MIANRTRERLQLRSAVGDELAEPPSLLPSRSVEFALRGNENEAAEFIAARAAVGEFSSAPAEVVVAAKSSRGFRPVHVLDIEQRVLLRALVNLLAPRVAYPDRSDEAYERFKVSPLVDGADDTVTHIVRADVASFYQYVDHRLLEGEIVAQTGDAGAATSIVQLTSSVMGRAFGLPQNIGPSHALADVYIDVVERQLLRRGQRVWRYNDDFVASASGLRHARVALEELESALRGIGLTLNDEKTMVLQRSSYEGWVERPSELRASISNSLDVDLSAWILLPATDYEGADDVDDEDDEAIEAAADHEAQAAGAERTLERWLEHVRSSDATDPLERYVFRILARDALRVLRRRLDPRGLPFCDSLLAFEPQLTHTTCRYLRRLAVVNPAAVAVVDELVSRDDMHLSVWQRMWLLEPLLAADDVPERLWPWVVEMTRDTSSTLRARAAFALATHRKLGPDVVGALFESSTSAARPDLVVAMVNASEGDAALVGSVSRQDVLLSFVASNALARL